MPEGKLKVGASLGTDGLWDQKSLTYRSHLGDLAYWHAMSVPNWLPSRIQEEMIDRIRIKFLAARREVKGESQGFELGKALHTLEDSYALSHTAREQTVNDNGTVTFGAITRFQSYGAQDHGKHGKGDVVVDSRDPVSQGSYDAAVAATTHLLEMFRDKTIVGGNRVREWLENGPLALTKGAINGGTEPAYGFDGR
jgi:hypothetical protein